MLYAIAGSAAVGGVIGYMTNWVAIRMLFRPLTEKRVFGMRVPFTPGLIPKKRARLAEAIGEIVSDYLLTTETLTASLATPVFEHSVRHFVGSAAEQLQRDPRTISEWVRLLLGVEDEQVVSWSQQSIAQLVSGEEIHRELLSAANAIISAAAGLTLGELLALDEQAAESRLAALLTAVLDQGRVGDRLQSLPEQLYDKYMTSEQSLADLLPEDLTVALRQLLLTQGPVLLEKADSWLQTEQARDLVKNLVKQVTGRSTMFKLIAGFLDLDKLASSLTSLLGNEETRIQINTWLLEQLNQLLQKPGKELGKFLPKDAVIPFCTSLLARLRDEKTIDKLACWISKAISNQQEVSIRQVAVALLGEREIAHAGDWARNRLQQVVCGPSFGTAVNRWLNSLLHRILQLQPGRLLGQLRPEHVTWLTGQVVTTTRAFVNRHGQDLLRSMQLTSVVQNQVDKLDILQVEELLLKVMSDQLRAITNLGLLLGAIIGSVMPFLNAWLMSL